MATRTVQAERISRLNDRKPQKRDYVLYWMQQSQRAEYNHAVEYAVQRANELDQPLVVAFGLMDDYPEANERHYRFMLEGLQEVQAQLARRGIKMVVRRGAPGDVAREMSKQASLVVCDRGYLRYQKAWRQELAEMADCEVVQIESDVVVPVDSVSEKREYAARTIRPKHRRQWERFLIDFRSTPVRRDSLNLKIDGVSLSDLNKLLKALHVDRSVAPVNILFSGGTSHAKRVLKAFIQTRLKNYEEHRNRPETSDVSHMGMYLHFGQISPLYVALEVSKSRRGASVDRESYLEELLIRRELAQNFVNFTADYDSYSCLPKWARDTLREHTLDQREDTYAKRELEDAKTHDAYWNAAMREMRYTGYMHNYMRMYWAKKIIEWTRRPEYAFEVILELNNKYFLDGRDPSSYANVAWAFGNHDRAFAERPIFGKIRYMSAAGLRRKADAEGYVEKVSRLVDQMKCAAER